MRRGERKAWRELAAAAQAVADSKNYAEEYMAKLEWGRAMDALFGCPLTPTLSAAATEGEA